MVDVMGHLAFGLLFALPAWFVWRKRVAAAFVALTLVTAPLPDVDVWLSKWFPQQIHHHGVTHTIVFVVLASLVVGVIAALVLTKPLDHWFGWERFDGSSMFTFAFLAFLLGGLSHIFVDMLSAPDIAQPIEPFWPFYDKPFSLDLLYFNDPLWNSVLLVAALLLHAGVAYAVTPAEHRYRFRGRPA